MGPNDRFANFLVQGCKIKTSWSKHTLKKLTKDLFSSLFSINVWPDAVAVLMTTFLFELNEAGLKPMADKNTKKSGKRLLNI